MTRSFTFHRATTRFHWPTINNFPFSPPPSPFIPLPSTIAPFRSPLPPPFLKSIEVSILLWRPCAAMTYGQVAPVLFQLSSLKRLPPPLLPLLGGCYLMPALINDPFCTRCDSGWHLLIGNVRQFPSACASRHCFHFDALFISTGGKQSNMARFPRVTFEFHYRLEF